MQFLAILLEVVFVHAIDAFFWRRKKKNKDPFT